MRDYFLWLLSETINATNIPKEIISVNALTMSIGKHLPPWEVSHRRLTADRQCYQTPHAKPVYWINYNILLSLILYLMGSFSFFQKRIKSLSVKKHNNLRITDLTMAQMGSTVCLTCDYVLFCRNRQIITYTILVRTKVTEG